MTKETYAELKAARLAADAEPTEVLKPAPVRTDQDRRPRSSTPIAARAVEQHRARGAGPARRAGLTDREVIGQQSQEDS